jgi:hypothetical protein
MKISKDTISVLKNFATINEKMLIPKGNHIYVVSEGFNLMASAEIPDAFPYETGVYEMNKFLSVLSFFPDMDLEFDKSEKFVTVVSADKKTNYRQFLTPPELLQYNVEDLKAIDNYNIKLPFPYEKFELALKMGAISKCDCLGIKSDGKKVWLTVMSIEDPTADHFQTELCDGNGEEYLAMITLEDLRLLKIDYRVEISKLGVARFLGTFNSVPVSYIVGVQPNSSFEEEF